MISASFELVLPVQRDDVLQQLKKSGGIQRATATREGWEYGVVFPDFATTRGFFEFLSIQAIDVDVRWMMKDRNPLDGPHGIQTDQTA